MTPRVRRSFATRNRAIARRVKRSPNTADTRSTIRTAKCRARRASRVVPWNARRKPTASHYERSPDDVALVVVIWIDSNCSRSWSETCETAIRRLHTLRSFASTFSIVVPPPRGEKGKRIHQRCGQVHSDTRTRLEMITEDSQPLSRGEGGRGVSSNSISRLRIVFGSASNS